MQFTQLAPVELPVHVAEHPPEHPDEQSDAQDVHPDEVDDALQLVEQPEQPDDVELFAQEF